MFARKQRRAMKEVKQESPHGVADEASQSSAHSLIESDEDWFKWCPDDQSESEDKLGFSWNSRSTFWDQVKQHLPLSRIDALRKPSQAGEVMRELLMYDEPIMIWRDLREAYGPPPGEHRHQGKWVESINASGEEVKGHLTPWAE